jgi:hypothetical protein
MKEIATVACAAAGSKEPTAATAAAAAAASHAAAANLLNALVFLFLQDHHVTASDLCHMPDEAPAALCFVLQHALAEVLVATCCNC